MAPMSLFTSDVFALLDSGRIEFSGLSAIQYGGDGFLIKQLGSVYDKNLQRPLAIGCALMKKALVDKFTLRAQLSIGDSADVSGTYSESMQKRIREKSNSSYLGFSAGGRFSNMLFNTVIGTSIFNAYRLQQPKGPLFVVDRLLATDLQKTGVAIREHDAGLLIDWLHYDHEYVRSAMNALGIDDSFNYRDALVKYIDKHRAYLPPDWKTSAEALVA